jgi:hypothetical protein
MRILPHIGLFTLILLGVVKILTVIIETQLDKVFLSLY